VPTAGSAMGSLPAARAPGERGPAGLEGAVAAGGPGAPITAAAFGDFDDDDEVMAAMPIRGRPRPKARRARQGPQHPPAPAAPASQAAVPTLISNNAWCAALQAEACEPGVAPVARHVTALACMQLEAAVRVAPCGAP
jgi:hypothetical protein